MKNKNNNTKLDDSVIKYYKEHDLTPVLVERNLMDILRCIGNRKAVIVISDIKLVRGICRVFGIPTRRRKGLDEEITQFYVMRDALKILNAKHIPVLFYNRVGLKKGFRYSKGSLYRIAHKLDFIKMSNDIEKYEDQLKLLVGDKYSRDYVEKLKRIPQIIKKGNLYCHEDYRSDVINVFGGERITLPDNDKATRIIHVFGRCGAFGYAVEDSETLPSRLQRLLLENGYTEYKVINHGLWGGGNGYILSNFFHELSGFKEGDIILFYMKHFNSEMTKSCKTENMYTKDITSDWHALLGDTECFYDRPGHMNNQGYGFVADIIYNDLKHLDFADSFEYKTYPEMDVPDLYEFLRKQDNSDFDNEIKLYISGLKQKYKELSTSGGKTGAIVMNCNPFTKGHRFLVEQALGYVDRLIIFVVEEDVSFFKFEDRYEMVKNGTSDLKNVVVVPSGKFVISTITFPEYFLKDYVKKKDFDISTDVETFCIYIAPELGISVRFAGEEPFDPVTANYNESMRKTLPEYGIEFVEIQRMRVDGTDNVINASEVRRLLSDERYDELTEYVPETTMEVLRKKYIRG